MHELLLVHAAAWIAFALVGIIRLSTALLQVPMHLRLVSSNWIHTIAWRARGVMVLGWLW